MRGAKTHGHDAALISLLLMPASPQVTLFICACCADVKENADADAEEAPASELALGSPDVPMYKDDKTGSHPIDCTDYAGLDPQSQSADADHRTAELQCHALELDEETEGDLQSDEVTLLEDYEESIGDNLSSGHAPQLDDETEDDLLCCAVSDQPTQQALARGVSCSEMFTLISPYSLPAITCKTHFFNCSHSFILSRHICLHCLCSNCAHLCSLL